MYGLINLFGKGRVNKPFLGKFINPVLGLYVFRYRFLWEAISGSLSVSCRSPLWALWLLKALKDFGSNLGAFYHPEK